MTVVVVTAGYAILAVSVAYTVAYIVVMIADKMGLIYSPRSEAKRHAGDWLRRP